MKHLVVKTLQIIQRNKVLLFLLYLDILKQKSAEWAFEAWSSEKKEDKAPQVADSFKSEMMVKTNPNDFSMSDTSATPSSVLDPKRQIEINERYAKSMDLNSIADLEKLLGAVVDNPEWFYKVNNVLRLPKASPYSKVKVLQIEKRLDETENLLKRWTKFLKQANMACEGYMKSVDAFANQLLVDKDFFEGNKELQHLVVMVAQFLKENSVYLEVFIKVINNSVYK